MESSFYIVLIMTVITLVLVAYVNSRDSNDTVDDSRTIKTYHMINLDS